MDSQGSYFVTGASGFVGACLVHRLVEQGKKVSILVKQESDLWRLKGIENKIDIFHGNLTDFNTVTEVIHKVRPMIIYHLATHGAYPFQDDAEKIISTNIFGTWNLLKACSDLDYKAFVNTGSSSEYGFKSSAMKETDLLEPNSYYAVAKSAQSLLCQHVARSQNRPICTFRLFSVYGYFEEPSRLFPTLIQSCLKGEDLNMVSPETARDFIFVEDVIDAYLSIERLSKLSGEIINIGTGLQTTLKEVVSTALELTDAKVHVHWGTIPPRIWDANIWVAGTLKSQQILGWKAQTSLKEGLRKTIEWFKAR